MLNNFSLRSTPHQKVILCFSSNSYSDDNKNISNSSSNSHYTQKLNGGINTLDPYYITGFADGEGCFSISIYKDSRMLTGWQVKPVFKISLHKRDRALLESIQKSLGVGKIYKHGIDSLDYRVSSLKNIRVVINHLDRYPLITKKLADYILFKQAVDMVQQKQHLTIEGILKLVSIKASLNWGLSEKFKESFPGVIPATRPLVEAAEIKDPNWLRGFIEAEGCFQVIVQKREGKATSTGLRFQITQHSRDSVLMESLVNYIGCGRYNTVRNRDEVNFMVNTFSDIYKNIIPFMEKYPLLGAKLQDYLDFVKVAELIKSKEHLTIEGLAKIEEIKSNTNTKRIYLVSNSTTEEK